MYLNKKDLEKHIEKSEIKKDITKWKVITARANGGKGCLEYLYWKAE